MQASHFVDSYRFWEVASLWAKERGLHETVLACYLAKAFIKGGLRIHSQDPRWLSGAADAQVLRGYPYVGYSPTPGAVPVIIRAGALEHLLAVVGSGREPEQARLHEEYIRREDLRSWLKARQVKPPRFWFTDAEIAAMNLRDGK
jgi:hypothetical protein